MKAWQLDDYGEPSAALRRVDVPGPDTGPGNVLVRVHAVALSLPDALMCRGTYAYKPPLPIVPGQEFAGEIVAVGEGVTDLSPGDRVAGVSAFFLGQGCFAERCPALGASVYPVDEALPLEQAAGFVIAYHTAHIGLVVRAGLAAGETLLVSGAAGGTGSAAVQLGKALGARVIAVASGPEKRAHCRQLGADEVLDATAPDLFEQVLGLTDGQGVDVVYDPVGAEFYEGCFDAVRHQGRVIPIGFAGGRWGETPIWTVVTKNISVVGALPAGFERASVLAAHRELLDLLGDGRIGCVVDHEVGFEEIPAGLQHVADRRSLGRVIAHIDQ